MQPDQRLAKPLPTADPLTQPFWDACARHTLVIQQCLSCRRLIHFPLPACPGCGSADLGWREVSGRGTIYSHVVVHHPVTPGFADDVPYVVAWVALAEQADVRLVCDVLGCDPGAVEVGAEVEICFEDRAPGVSLPQCRLAGPATGARS